MQNRLTFLLTVGSTLAVGLYGLIGALYLELLKERVERNNLLTAILFLMVLSVATVCISYFINADRLSKNKD